VRQVAALQISASKTVGWGVEPNPTASKNCGLFLGKTSYKAHETSINVKKHISSLLLLFHKVLFHSRKAFRARPSLHQELALLPEKVQFHAIKSVKKIWNIYPLYIVKNRRDLKNVKILM
jgi:hypothetical protein